MDTKGRLLFWALLLLLTSCSERIVSITQASTKEIEVTVLGYAKGGIQPDTILTFVPDPVYLTPALELKVKEIRQYKYVTLSFGKGAVNITLPPRALKAHDLIDVKWNFVKDQLKFIHVKRDYLK